MVRLNDDKEMVKSIKRGLNAQVAIVRAGYSTEERGKQVYVQRVP